MYLIVFSNSMSHKFKEMCFVSKREGPGEPFGSVIQIQTTLYSYNKYNSFQRMCVFSLREKTHFYLKRVKVEDGSYVDKC